MQRRRMGRTGLEISVVGFGAWAIGGDHNTGGSMGPADDSESVAAIHRAIELGANWIDTAPGYGTGHSEEIVARALRGMAEPPMIFTKCGFVWGADRAPRICLTPESIRQEAEASLRRLEVDAIDLYQIHWMDPEHDHEIEGAWETLAELQRAGSVRHIGVSNFDVPQLRRAQAIAPVETLQPPYSLLDRTLERDLLPYCAEHDIGVIVYSPMQSGLLTGAMTRDRVEALPVDDARRDDPNYSEPALSANLEFVADLERLTGGWGWPTGRAAVAWVLDNPRVSGAIVGFRRPSQVDPILTGDLGLTAERRREIDALLSRSAT